MAKGTGRGLTIDCWMLGIYKKNVRRTENSEVSNFTLYVSIEWNFTIEDSVKLVDLLVFIVYKFVVELLQIFLGDGGKLRVYSRQNVIWLASNLLTWIM